MGAGTPGPSVQADIEERETKGGGPGTRGHPGWGGREAGPRALRNKEGARMALSIPLSLGGWSQHRLAGGATRGNSWELGATALHPELREWRFWSNQCN